MIPDEKQKRLRYLQLKKKKALATATIQDEPSFSENLVKDAKNVGAGFLEAGEMIAKAPIQAPMVLGKSVMQLTGGTPLSETDIAGEAAALGNLVKTVPGAIARRAGEIITSPQESFIKRPISTVLDVASVAPMVGMASKVAQASKLGQKVGAIAEAGKARVGNAAVRGLEAFTSTPEKAIRRRLDRPQQVKSAIAKDAEEAPFVPVADELAQSVNKLGQDARKSAVNADEKLSKSIYLNDGAIPRDEMLSIVEKERQRLSTQGRIVGNAKKAAADRLDELAEDIRNLEGETVSQFNVKKFVQSLDNDIDWGTTTNAPSNLALERVRYRLDSKLKEGNPAYRAEIAESARKTRVFKRAERQFGLQKEVGGGLQPTDATVSKLKSVSQTRMPFVEKRLRDVTRETGADFVEKTRDIDAALKLQGGVTAGSRKAVSGLGIGASIGGLSGGPVGAGIGGTLGTIIGLLTDVRGRSMAGAAIGGYERASKVAELLKMTQYDPRVRALIQYSNNPINKRLATSYYGSRGVPPEDF